MQDRRGRRIALIGDDLVAGVIEIESAQRDGRAGGNGGGRGVGDRSFARAKSAGRQPPVVGEIDDGIRLDVTQEDEREGVRRAAVVLNDGDVADGENGGHGRLFPAGSSLRNGRVKIVSRGPPSAAVFSSHRSKHGSTSEWVARPRAIDSAGYWIETPSRLVPSPALLAKALVDRASQGSFLQSLEQVRRRPGRPSSRAPTPLM
jgi:hypothetical protein